MSDWCEHCNDWVGKHEHTCGLVDNDADFNRTEIARLSAMNEKYNVLASEDATELAKLRGENERLRAALDGYYRAHQGSATISSEQCPCIHCEKYRAALAGKEREG